MAEAFAVEVAVEVTNNIIKKFGSAAFKKILSVKDQDSQIERLQGIKSIFAAALRRVDPFEESDDVQGVIIAKLRRIHDDLVYFFDELETRAKQKEVMGSRNIAAKLRSVLPSYTMAKKVQAITTELESFVRDYASLAGSIVTDSSRNQNRCTLFLETGPIPDTDKLIGRDTDKEKIINMLCNSSNDQMSPSAVAIVGVGGQGKTTLAQYVCQDERVKGSFNEPLWVSAAPESSFREILEKIITSATGEKPCNYTKEQLQHLLLHAIVGKKCLLVLDNIWYHGSLSADWLELRTLLSKSGFEGSGSKFLITTRSERAAKIMGMPELYMLRDLAENDSWTLLLHFALAQQQEKESGKEEIGKEIAKMCPKLPLVIKVVGLQLAEMDTTTQWKNFMKKLASTSTLYMQDKNMQTLKLCYDQLYDENLKRCVVYCSLFPKGHTYSTNRMVGLWMALGFLQPEVGISLEGVGEEYVVKLLNLGFFEQAYCVGGFKMHDVMHDLMLSIGESMHQAINSETKEIANGVRHVSLNTADLNWKVLLEFREKQNLESIILVSGHGKHCSIQVPSRLDKLISICQKLKVLEVSSQEIEKVPRSIGQMRHLRYLNLSGNPLHKLPNSVTQLVNLMSLNVSRCPNLQELPRDINKLYKLKALNLSRNPLRKLPNYITQLVNLMSLDVSFCPNLQELPRDINKLDKLKELKIRGHIILGNNRERGTLSHMPKGIGKLSNLEELDFFVVVGEDKSIASNSEANGAAKLEELGCLNNLQGDLWIIVEGESKHIISEAKTSKPLEKKTDLIRLVVEFKNSTEEDEMFLEALKPNGKNLSYINIINYGGKKLPSWMRDDQFRAHFPKIGHIDFFYDDKYQYWEFFPFSDYSNFHHDKKECVVKIRMRNVDGHDGMLEWVPGHSRLKEQSRFGPVDIKLTSVKGNGLKDLSVDSLKIEKHMAQSVLGLKLERSFLNIHQLALYEIPELEAIPDQFQDLSSLEALRIFRCRNLKAIPGWIGSLTSLTKLYIEGCLKLESLPHQIGSLTSLRELFIGRCPKLESLPHEIGNLSESCAIIIPDCSQVLVNKCWKETGEYWPLIQHICHINITYSDDVHVRQGDLETWLEKNRKVTTTALVSTPSNDAPTPLTSNASPSHFNTTSLKLYLLLILAFIIIIIMFFLVCVVGLYLV